MVRLFSSTILSTDNVRIILTKTINPTPNMRLKIALFIAAISVAYSTVFGDEITYQADIRISDDPSTSQSEGNLTVEGSSSMNTVTATNIMADILNLQGYAWSSVDTNTFSGQGMAIGFKNKAAPWSLMIGQGNIFEPTLAGGQMSLIVGSGNISYASTNSMAVGCENSIRQNSSIALGIGNSVGPHMAAIGADLISNTKFQISVGSANDTSINASTSMDVWNPEDPIFVVGNGETKDTRSNALVIRKSGDAEVYGELRVFKPSPLLPMGKYALDETDAMPAAVPEPDSSLSNAGTESADNSIQ